MSGKPRRRVIEQPDSSEDESSQPAQPAKPRNVSQRAAPVDFKKPAPPSSSRPGTSGRQPSQHVSSQGRQAGSSQSQSQGSQKRRTQRTRDSDDGDDALGHDFTDGRKLEKKEMITTVTSYFINAVHGKSVVRKSDIVKNLMNKQSRDFSAVIKGVEKKLIDIFGIVLVGFKEEAGNTITCPVDMATSFLIISKFKGAGGFCQSRKVDVQEEATKASLVFILAICYMLEKPITEDFIWEQLGKLDFHHLLKIKKEEFKRFLKTEYLDSMYLKKADVKLSPDDYEKQTVYDWGIRAEAEFTKLSVLQFVAKTMGVRPQDFHSHYLKLSPEEKVAGTQQTQDE